MKVAFDAGVSSEHQDNDLPISTPLRALRKCDSCDDCPGGNIPKQEIREILARMREKGPPGVADIAGPDFAQMANRSSPGG